MIVEMLINVTLTPITLSDPNYSDPNYSEQPFKGPVGAAHHVRKACEDMGKCWVHGISQCEKLFSSS